VCSNYLPVSSRQPVRRSETGFPLKGTRFKGFGRNEQGTFLVKGKRHFRRVLTELKELEGKRRWMKLTRVYQKLKKGIV
jgi:hypothetical protein